ncbi:MAG TPA: ROK family protein [Flavobacteriales bacterium]|nr:ROK family protein [Flavobacteriales bacterium]
MKEVTLGVDIGGTNTAFGFVDREGNCLAEGNISTGKHKDITLFFDELTEKIKHVQHAMDKNIKVRGIGIGAPNGNYYHGTIEHAPNLPWKGVIAISMLFKERFDLPAYVTNDANAAAIGEMLYGAAKQMKDFVLITLGTGVGSGIVSNGQLIYGHDGFGGELGHTIIEENGRDCACGRSGCLETYASATGIVRTATMKLEETSQSSVLREVEPADLSGKMITEAALEGDALALDVFDYTAQKLGLSLANTVAITSPEAIILFGGLAKAGNLLIHPVSKYMEANLFSVFKGKVKLLSSGLQEQNAAILGASALAWQELKKEHYNAVQSS